MHNSQSLLVTRRIECIQQNFTLRLKRVNHCSDPTCWGGGRNHVINWVFCLIIFGRLIKLLKRNVIGIIKKLVERRIWIQIGFLVSFFSRSYWGLKFCVNTGYLAWFCLLFYWLIFFSKEILGQNYTLGYKLKLFQCC